MAGLLGSTSLAPTKMDEIKIKANVLAAFITKKADEAADTAEGLANDAAGAAKDGAAQVIENAESILKQAQKAAAGVHAEL